MRKTSNPSQSSSLTPKIWPSDPDQQLKQRQPEMCIVGTSALYQQSRQRWSETSVARTVATDHLRGGEPSQ